jgi:hypothetical protein
MAGWTRPQHNSTRPKSRATPQELLYAWAEEALRRRPDWEEAQHVLAWAQTDG